MADRSLASFPEGESSPGQLVTVATFHTPYEGHLALGALRSEGIPSWLLGSHHAEVAPHLSIAVGARLATLESDQKHAVAILRDAEDAPGWEFCPHCGSFNIRRRKRLWIILTMFLLLGIASPYVPHNARRCCYDCGHKWVFSPTR